jgi:hypothetical protein
MPSLTQKTGDPPQERNRTRSFFGWEQLWDGLSYELQDVRWNKGGLRVFIHGTGHAVVQVVDAQNVETRYELRLKREHLAALRDVMIREDLLALENPPYLPVKGETHADIHVYGELGSWKYVSKYERRPEPRFDAVREVFLTIRDEAVKLPPTYQGKYVSYYKPNQGTAVYGYRLRKWLFKWRFWHPRELLRAVGEFVFLLIALWPHLLFLAGMTVIAFFFVRIDPNVAYGFQPAILHGLFGIPNLILTPFTDHVAAAPKNTGFSYNLGYVVGLCVIPWLVRQALELALLLFKEWLKR